MTEFNTFVFQMLLHEANLNMMLEEQQKKIAALQHENQELNILLGYLKDFIQEHDISELKNFNFDG